MISFSLWTIWRDGIGEALFPAILLTYWRNFLLPPRLYGPLTALPSLSMDVHYSLSTAFCRHLLTFVSARSFCVSSIHRNLGLPLLLLPFDLLSYVFLTVLPWSILTIVQNIPVSAALHPPPLKKTTLSSEWEVRTNPEAVRTFYRRQESLASSGNRTTTPLLYTLYLSY